jgi:hypothetical protein
MKALVGCFLFVAGAGCATSHNARIVPINSDTYRVASPNAGLRSDEKVYVYDQAARFCANESRDVKIVQLDSTPGGSGFGGKLIGLPVSSKATLLFKCVARTPGRS